MKTTVQLGILAKAQDVEMHTKRSRKHVFTIMLLALLTYI